jgi:hypothetical protein
MGKIWDVLSICDHLREEHLYNRLRYRFTYLGLLHTVSLSRRLYEKYVCIQ